MSERTRRMALWGTLLTVGLALTGLCAFALAEGLERADQLASVLGGSAGLIGLPLTVYSTLQARRAAQAPLPADDPDSDAGAVAGNRFDGPTAFQTGADSRQTNHFG